MQRVGGRAPPRSSFRHLNPGSEAGGDSTKGPLSGPPGPVASQCPEPTPSVLSGPSRQGGVYWQLGAWPFPPHRGRQPAQGPSGDCPRQASVSPQTPLRAAPSPQNQGTTGRQGQTEPGWKGPVCACACEHACACTRECTGSMCMHVHTQESVPWAQVCRRPPGHLSPPPLHPPPCCHPPPAAACCYSGSRQLRSPPSLGLEPLALLSPLLENPRAA